MHKKHHKALLLFLLLFVSGCTNEEKKLRRENLRGEHLIRKHDEYFFTPPPPQPRSRESYPWEDKYIGSFPRISKEFFRCKGNPLNPVIVQDRGDKESFYYRDCSGRRHGLPIKDGQEFVYPCLINLLNFVQEKTEKRVVITAGHRCPTHNAYCDYTPYNWGSKHMLGAEVDFYVEGMEEQPEAIIKILMEYYPEEEFTRFKSEGLNISTPPWYNKEIFIKLYHPLEGRNHDNQHAYPYIGIQVRYDCEENKRIIFNQEQSQNYLRH